MQRVLPALREYCLTDECSPLRNGHALELYASMLFRQYEAMSLASGVSPDKWPRSPCAATIDRVWALHAGSGFEPDNPSEDWDDAYVAWHWTRKGLAGSAPPHAPGQAPTDPADTARCIIMSPFVPSRAAGRILQKGVCVYGASKDPVMLASGADDRRGDGDGINVWHGSAEGPGLLGSHKMECILQGALSACAGSEGAKPLDWVPGAVYTMRGTLLPVEWAMNALASVTGVYTPGIARRAGRVYRHWEARYGPGGAAPGTRVVFFGHSLGGTLALAVHWMVRRRLLEHQRGAERLLEVSEDSVQTRTIGIVVSGLLLLLLYWTRPWRRRR